jgi:hypothetical protein
VPGHAGAWALGMLVAFAGISVTQDDTPVALAGAATALAMGAVVAALTGLVLVRPRSTVISDTSGTGRARIGPEERAA